MNKNIGVLLKYNMNKVIHNRVFVLSALICLFIYLWVIFSAVNSDGFSHREYKDYKCKIINKEISAKETYDYISGADEKLAAYIVDELKYAASYDDKISRVLYNGDALSEISIFSGSDDGGFSKLNIQKTVSDFEPFSNMIIAFTGTKGFSSILNNYMKNIISIIMMGLIVVLLRLEDIRMNIDTLTNTTRNGRGILAVVNIFSILIFSTLIIVIYTIIDLVTAICLYGGIDFSEPIQALYGYENVTMGCSIGVYLIIRILFKIFTLFSISVFFAAVSLILLREIHSLFAFVVVFLLTELCKLVPLHSRYEFIRCLCFSDWLAADKLLKTYVNVNIFCNPVRQYTVVLFFGILLLILSICLFMRYFVKHSVSRQKKSLSDIVIRKTKKQHSILFYEFKKSFINKKIWIMAVVIFALMMIYNFNQDVEVSINDKYYKYYVNMYEGEITDLKLQSIEETAEKYKEYNLQRAMLNTSFKNGDISENEYYSKAESYDNLLLGELGFNKMCDRLSEIKTIGENGKKQPQLVYDEGWNTCFGLNKNNWNEKISFLFLTLFVIMGVSGIYAYEMENGMDKLIYVYKNSQMLKREKYITGLCTIPVGIVITYLPLFLYSYKVYGLSCLFAPVTSIAGLSGFGLDISIFTYAVIFFVIRIFAMIIVASVVMLLSCKMKNTIKTIIFSIPIIILVLLI